jgi:hypothetical protein
MFLVECPKRGDRKDWDGSHLLELPWTFLRNAFQQTALRFDEQVFLDYALIFFKRAFDLIHVTAVSIWHRSNDL